MRRREVERATVYFESMKGRNREYGGDKTLHRKKEQLSIWNKRKNITMIS